MAYISEEPLTVSVTTHVDKSGEDCCEADDALLVVVPHTLAIEQKHLKENDL